MCEDVDLWYWEKENPFEGTRKELIKWVDDNERIPSSSSKDETERRLGDWCHKKRCAKLNNKLSPDIISKLESISFWYWCASEALNIKFNKRCKEVKEWSEANDNKIPSTKAKDKIEKKYGMWCMKQRKKKRNNELTSEQINKLDEITNWWW